jgi:hypothetical protein
VSAQGLLGLSTGYVDAKFCAGAHQFRVERLDAINAQHCTCLAFAGFCKTPRISRVPISPSAPQRRMYDAREGGHKMIGRRRADETNLMRANAGSHIFNFSFGLCTTQTPTVGSLLLPPTTRGQSDWIILRRSCKASRADVVLFPCRHQSLSGYSPCCLYDNFLHGHLLPMMRIVDLECTADDGDHDFPGMFQVSIEANHLFPLTLNS